MSHDETSKHTIGGMSAGATIGAMAGGPPGAFVGGVVGGLIGLQKDQEENNETR